MKTKGLKIPAILIAIGLVFSLAACLFTNMIMTPATAAHDFDFSITYKLGDETKTIAGVYRCQFDGYREGDDPADRYYTGEYIVDGQVTQSHSYTIAEKDGAELYIVVVFNDCYLMGDTKDTDYEPFHEAPYLEAVDKGGYSYDETNMPDAFTAEIISWDYPDPIENNFVFSGFSILHAGSMLAMLAVGLLTAVACMIFVKKDKAVPYKELDKLSTLANFAACFLVIPFFVVCIVFMLATMGGADIMMQILLCTPAITAFTVAASIALRRNGFTKTGFFIQFAGPVLFFVPVVLDSIIGNLFG